jgi:hypothetical protein
MMHVAWPSTVRKTLAACGILLGVCAYGACSSGDGSSGSPSEGQGGASSQPTATGGQAVGLGGAATTGGSGAGVGGSGAGGSSGTSTYPNIGVRGETGTATADATSFDGHDVRYIIGENGFGTRICEVQFDLKRVGDAPPGCTACDWAHLLEFSNPTILTDADGVCAKSDLALDTAAITRIVGSRVALGFAAHLGGAHGSARMIYFEDKQVWDVAGNATWSETTKAFFFDDRQGYCNYGP